MPLDPTADPGRRAWLPCPNCAHGTDCHEGNCTEHWQFLLANRATVLHLQCPSCTHLWSHDTRKSA
ncbi:hypothetical protein SAMN05421504_10719 [Amycolatopsis xylanica]|uniref:Uncharacterized protein n=1 Tax=Amycolatopsis xylanica TaxID=589385 RepID=A0A1H3MVP5_9PSEU|nr:hypothetical protein [Amycolatopsis xylanica]SDY80603.1 hypothetical protein SAMN05421504_10719 [Amycolatopsis xylanica]